jgi:hypothetical protein
MDDTGVDDRIAGPIEVVGRTTRAEIGDRVEVEWALSVPPGLEWTEVFQFTSFDGADDPADWHADGGPDVVGDVVRWFVPTAVIDDADAEVTRRVGIANLRCAP